MQSVPPNSLVIQEATQVSVRDKSAKQIDSPLEWSI
jgi:hypothetical protein